MRTSHIPIILLTALADQKSKIEGLAAGADAYLIKPFAPNELFIRIDKLIALRKTLQEHYNNILKTIKERKSNRKEYEDKEDSFLKKVRFSLETNRFHPFERVPNPVVAVAPEAEEESIGTKFDVIAHHARVHSNQLDGESVDN